MKKGNIILLNGVSSSGKTTLSKRLEKCLPDYYHLSIDDFDSVIESMEDRENGRLIPVPTEYFFHRNIQMFSDKGINLIVDQIIHDEFTLKDCYETLHNYPLLFVGVHSPLEVIEERELARGDRTVGQARGQLRFVHQQNEIYHIEVDTFLEPIEVCVEKIVGKIKENGELPDWKPYRE